MTRNRWQHLVRSLFVPKSARGSSSRQSGNRKLKNRFRPRMEALEAREVPATLVVNTLADESDHTDSLLSLREAIAVVNSQSTADLSVGELAQISGTLGTDTIQFESSLFNGGAGTIMLSGSELQITQTSGATTITGPGADMLTISGDNKSRVFEIGSESQMGVTGNVTGGTVNMSGLTITEGFLATDRGNGDINQVSSPDQLGGGILNDGTLTVRDCVITGNQASTGGGIASDSTLTINNSTVSDNKTTFSNGGGLENFGAAIQHSMTVVNCTITGNSTAAAGGGIRNVSSLSVFDSTIAGNSASDGGGVSNRDDLGAVTNLSNSIIASNTGSNSGPDISGTVTSTSSLIGNTSGATINGSYITGDPLLAPLGNYGGPTQTMALLPGSPAIDAGTAGDNGGDDGSDNGSPIPSTDQRGFSRVGAVDIGAVEAQGFTLSLVSGNNQLSGPGEAFSNALVTQVTENKSLAPMPGVVVTYTAPFGNVASTNPDTTSATTASDGQAADSVTANGISGGYQVVASAKGVGNSVSFTLTNDAPPVVTVNGPSSDPEGTAVTFTGSFTGTAPGQYAYTWHVVADNGQSIADQSGSASGPGVPDFIFSPDDDGTYTVSLTVTDQFNLTGTQSASTTVTNVNPTAHISGMTQPNQLFILPGDMLKFSGDFTDPGTADGHTVTWDFGDHNSSSSSYGAGGSAAFSIKHAYANPGTYTVTLSVTDDDNGVGTRQMIVVVQSPAGAIGNLIAYVQTLSNLNQGQQNSLTSSLNGAIDSLNQGDKNAALNKLDAFESKVNTLLAEGILTQDQVTVLLSSEDAIDMAIG